MHYKNLSATLRITSLAVIVFFTATLFAGCSAKATPSADTESTLSSSSQGSSTPEIAEPVPSENLPPVTDEVSSAVTVAPEQALPTKAELAKLDAFAVDTLNISAYVFNGESKTSAQLYHSDAMDEITSAINNLKPCAGTDIGKSLTPLDSLILEEPNGTRIKYEFFEKGIHTVVSNYRADYSEERSFPVEKAGYDKLLDTCKKLFDESSKHPYWLTLINNDKVKSAIIDTACEENTPVSVTDTDKLQRLLVALKQISVSNAGTIIDGEITSTDGAVVITISFKNGINYTIFCTETKLVLKSSDIDYALSYTVNKGETQSIVSLVGENAVDAGDLIPETGKPVIYLYPQQKTDVTVKLSFNGDVTYTYPAYNDGWQVTAFPDGKLINKADDTEHYYLFWEGNAYPKWEISKGFVVKGSDSESFLREKLSYLGLTPREYNDFIVYWVPKMQDNAYILISFSGSEYYDIAKLNISPAPDSILRVHMMFKALDEYEDIAPQQLSPFTRKGFTVVEWGGTEIK